MTGRQAARGKAETEPLRNLPRGSRAGRSQRSRGASWRNIPAKSASLVTPSEGWESEGGFAQSDGLPKKGPREVLWTSNIWVSIFPMYSLSGEGAHYERLKDFYS